MNPDTQIQFDPDFVWGAATASYQIEGAWNEDGKGESIWDRFCHTPGTTKKGDTGDIACDHYHQYREDVEMMSGLNLKAYRFSISWPRILPDGTGQVNQKGLDFYSRLIDALLDKNITPFITLYHWDLPQALEDKGGWRNRDICRYFSDYAQVAAEHFSDRVEHWMTLNEPPCIAYAGYREGHGAPGAREPQKVINQIIHHLLLAHGMALRTIRQTVQKSVQVGLAHNPNVKLPASEQPADIDFARKIFHHCNAWWLDPLFTGDYPESLWNKQGPDVPHVEPDDLEIISTPMDFLGVNAYFAGPVVPDDTPGSEGFREIPYPPDHPRTSTGWPVNPDTMYYVLKYLHDIYDIPAFYVTESGCALTDAPDTNGRVQDPRRTAYLHDHIKAAWRAMQDGANLKGYFVWSLMDNLEWSDGFDKRFGIVYVDFDTLKRTPKDSARWYSRLCETGILT